SSCVVQRQSACTLRHHALKFLVNQVNSVVAMAHGANVRILFEGFYHFAQLGGCPPVVAIQESDDLALSLRDSGVKCRRLAAVGFPNQAQAWLELPYDLG